MKTKEIEEMISDLINRKATPADLINYISTLRQSVLDEIEDKIRAFMDIRKEADKAFEVTELINYINGKQDD